MDGLLFLLPDGFFHLNFLMMPCFVVEFGAQAGEVLGVFGDFVCGAGSAFTGTLVVVEAPAVLLLEALDVFVLRHSGRRVVGRLES